MSNTKISQMAVTGYKGTLQIPAVDESLPAGQQNVRVNAAALGAAAPAADGTTIQLEGGTLTIASVPLTAISTTGAASGDVLTYNGEDVTWAASAAGGLTAPVAGNTVATIATTDDLVVWTGGAQKYITAANLLTGLGETISQGTPAAAITGTNKFWIGQGGSSDVVATMAQVLTYVQANLPAAQPVTKAVSADYTLTAADNGLDLVCTAAVTISPPASFSTLGDGWKARVINGTASGVVTLAAGIQSAAGSTISAGAYASLLATAAPNEAGVVLALVDGLILLPPGIPTALAAGTPTFNSIPVTWDAPTGSGGSPSSYTLQYRTDPSGAWQQITGITTLAHTITGLAASTEYDIEVAAVNAAGSSAFTAQVTATTVAAPVAPSAPTALAGVATQTDMTLSWTAPTTGTAPFTYTVQSAVHGGTLTTVQGGIGGTSFDVTGLLPGTSYDFAVFATGPGGPGTAATLTKSTTALTLLLDQISGTSTAAYSFRKLRGAYSGPAIQLSAGAGPTLGDIGFDAQGNLDTAAAIAFANANGGGTATVNGIYDQSGNGFHAYSSGNPFALVSGGAAIPVGPNSRFGLIFSNGGAHTYQSSFSSTSITSAAAACVFGTDGATASSIDAFVFSQETNGGAVNLFAEFRSATLNDIDAVYGGSPVQPIINGTAGNTLHASSLNSVYSTGAPGSTSGTTTFHIGYIGEFCNICECIAFEAALSTGDQTTVYNSQKTYFGTP